MIDRSPSSSFRVICDLHSHSTASDGLLSPQELVLRAARLNIEVLALTDHDEVAGVPAARTVAAEHGVELVAGVEISTTWSGRTIHILGLRVDIEDSALLAGLHANRSGRRERARRMGESLAEVGIAGALEGAMALAENAELISRSHFARYLIGKGYARNMKSVFKRFLVRGKPGYVVHQWASLADAVGWIHRAGGLAVLAHPGRYEIGKENMARLLTEFKGLGGEGIEVVTGSHTADQVPIFADYAERYGLLASVGSDFHAPGEGGRELGRLMPLPAGCRPVWQAW